MGAHCFGKLPLAGDFLRHNVNTPPARMLASWIEKGQALVEAVRRSSGDPSGGAKSPARRFRFVFDDGRDSRLLAGILHESHDKVGGGGSRRFPFTYFVDIDAGPARRSAGRTAWDLHGLWEGMEARLAGSTGARDAPSFFKLIDEPGIEDSGIGAGSGYEEAMRSARAGDLWRQILQGGGPDARTDFFEYLLRVLRPHAGRRPSEASVAIKLPLPSGDAGQARLACAFWAELVTGVLRPQGELPHLYVVAPEPGGPPTAIQVHFRPLDESGFASLMTERYATDYVDDLTRKIPPRRGESHLDDAGRRLVLDDSATLESLCGHRWLP